MSRATYPEIEVILLAAGLSRRMGAQNKLLIEVDGKPLVLLAVELYLDLGMAMTLVLGHEADRIRHTLDGLSVRTVVNENYAEGQQSSVQVGLEAASLKGKGVLIALADQPFLTRHDVQDLCQAYLAGRQDKIMIPWCGGVRGNPVLLPPHLARLARDDERYPGCRAFIDAHPDLTQPYGAASTGFIRDLDTPEDVALISKDGR